MRHSVTANLLMIGWLHHGQLYFAAADVENRHISQQWRNLEVNDVMDQGDILSENEAMEEALHINFLTACISPFRTYIPGPENLNRLPFGNVRITFDGGQSLFHNITEGMYPGYDPDLEFTFQYDLQGLPSNCNACRIQVNAGNSCDHPDIRYWNRSVPGAMNPWRPEWGAVYYSNHNGQARGTFSMFDGFSFDDHKSRTVVVFEQDKKTRIGCGVIRRSNHGECGSQSFLPSFSPTNNPSPLVTTTPTISSTTSNPSATLLTVQPQQEGIPSSSSLPLPDQTESQNPSLNPMLTSHPNPTMPTSHPSIVQTNIPSFVDTKLSTTQPTSRPTNPPTNLPLNQPTSPPVNTPIKSTDLPTYLLTASPRLSSTSYPSMPPTQLPSCSQDSNLAKPVSKREKGDKHSLEGKDVESRSKNIGKKGGKKVVKRN
jgi:hypothetical protein